MIDRKIIERVQRILALPEEIGKLERQRVALRAERRTAERKLKKQATLVRAETIQLDDDYKNTSNQKERDVFLEAALHNDDVWVELSERVDQLTTTIERVEADLSTLDHERKALKAALEREYAAVIEELHSDRLLADVASSRRLKGVDA